MFGLLLGNLRTAFQVLFALSVLVSVQAQAQSIVGTWTTQGRDWVFFFQTNGQGVLVGTGLDSSCSGVASKSGTYTASAGLLNLVGDPYYWCNGNTVPQTPGGITANYVLSGNTLTLNNIQTNGQGITSLTLTLVPAQTGRIVGAWTMQRLDWVWNFQANGQYTVTGTGVGPNCETYVGSLHGNYTASGGVFGTSTDSAACNGVTTTGVGPTGQGGYVFTGNTLTLFFRQTSGQNVGQTYGFILTTQGGQVTPPPPTITPTTPLPPPPTSQTVFAAPTGQLPTAAVSVSPSGTFGNATLAVTLDLSKVLSGGSFAGLGQFAADNNIYNIYVAALAPKGVLGLPAAAIFVLPASRVWAPLGSPLAAYMEGLAKNATDKVVISILSDLDVTGLVGTEIYIGYGISDTEMLAASRYRGVYKVQ